MRVVAENYEQTHLYTQGAGPEHNTAKLYASARTRPLNSRPRALALAMYLHIFIFRVAVNTYVPIFRGLDARGGRKLRTDTHTHTNTWDNYSNSRCAHARRGLIMCTVYYRDS